jgi:hypothetical protein
MDGWMEVLKFEDEGFRELYHYFTLSLTPCFLLSNPFVCLFPLFFSDW